MNNTGEDKGEGDTKAKHEAKKIGKQMFEAGMYICAAFVVAGGLWLGYLGVFGHSKSQKTIGICVLFGTLFFLLVGAFLYFLQRARQQEAAQTNIEQSVVAQLRFVSSKLLEPLTVNKEPVAEFVITNTSNGTIKGRFFDRSWAITNVPPGTVSYARSDSYDEFILKAGENLAASTNVGTILGQGRIDGLNAEPPTMLLFIFARGEYADETGRTYPFNYCFRYDKRTSPALVACSPDDPVIKGYVQERSWLTALDFVLPEEPNLNKEIAVKYSVAITGKAPAADVTLQSQASIWHKEPPRFEPGLVDPKLGAVSRGTLFPGPNLGPSVNFTAPYVFPPESIAAYRSKKALLYVQVLLNYSTGGHPHWARVCAYHAFGEPLDHFTHCEHDNEMDENR